MKTKKFLAIFSALVMGTTMFALAACGEKPEPNPDPDEGQTVTPPGDDNGNNDGNNENGNENGQTAEPVYGLPVAERGHYIKNADLVEDNGTRYLLYTTNETSGEEDNVIAVRKATYEEGEGKGWLYGEEKVAIVGETGAWDENIGSASIVKGDFLLGGTSYGWLIAYCATTKTNDTQYQIGLAVASAPDGAWTKVSETPFITFDAAVYGETAVGCYAPSLVNLDRQSAVRIFYSYADAYGHFAKFTDLDASDLTNLVSEQAWEGNFVTNDGEITGGDAESMFPNADFAYDATSGKIFAVKDYSPSASSDPKVAEQIQLLWLAEDELYTVEEWNGWNSLKQWDSTDTPDGEYERLYGACVVSDAYGHVDGATEIEIVYNVCELKSLNADYLFTQNLLSFHTILA